MTATYHQTALIKSASLEEMTGHRDAALAAYKVAETAITAFASACARGLPGADHTRPSLDLIFDRYSRPNHDDTPERIVDRYFWRRLLAGSGLKKLMGAQQIAEFERGIENPIPFTLDNIRATFERYAANPAAVFERSVVDLFESLPSFYKSNDAFRFGERIVLTYAFSGYGWHYALSPRHTCRRDEVRDLSRIFHILDGKPFEVDFTDLAARALDDGAGEFADDYMKLRRFKNGNAHLWLLREDLVRQCNRILAAHYGAALANAA